MIRHIQANDCETNFFSLSIFDKCFKTNSNAIKKDLKMKWKKEKNVGDERYRTQKSENKN